MIRHLLVLPDGRQISSGGPGQAIREVKRTVYCNEGSELAPGAVAASVLEMEVFAADSLGLAAGEEVALYRVSDGGERSLLGIFRLEKPTRISRNLLRLTACDRLSLLDRDVSLWLASLNGWPYKLWDFLSMVFDHCGLEWVDETIPCADLKVDAFSAAGITGRQLISWGAQLAGRFCRATADGRAEFGWYTPKAFPVGPTGEAFYYQGSLSFEDYQVEKIQKIRLRQTATDVGAIYPDTDERLNTLAITGNLLLSGCDLATRQAVAQGLLEQLQDITYTPMTLAVPEQLGLGAGDMLCVQAPDGQMRTAYIMESTHTGGRAELHRRRQPGGQRRLQSAKLQGSDRPGAGAADGYGWHPGGEQGRGGEPGGAAADPGGAAGQGAAAEHDGGWPEAAAEPVGPGRRGAGAAAAERGGKGHRQGHHPNRLHLR